MQFVFPGATVVNDKMYVIGGASGSQGMKNCLQYDPSVSTWSSIAPLNEGMLIFFLFHSGHEFEGLNWSNPLYEITSSVIFFYCFIF